MSSRGVINFSGATMSKMTLVLGSRSDLAESFPENNKFSRLSSNSGVIPSKYNNFSYSPENL